MKNSISLKTVDLFAGCGGLTLGFKKAGFNIVAAFDNWEPAIEVYKANIKSHPIYNMDLSEDSIEYISGFRPDVIIGGPPCQDFSSAGKRDESLGRADLTVAFAKMISGVKPKYFVMENVDRALKSRVFKTASKIFKDSGYGLTVKVLNASNCGVPQTRKRLFVIGELNGKDGFLEKPLNDNLTNPITLRQYFKNKLSFEYYYRHPRSYARRAVFSIDEPSPTIRGVNRPVPKGYKGHPGDKTIICTDIRALTTKERCMIQTFPANFKLKGVKTEDEQLIGNAVPVKLAEYVAKKLSEYIKNK
ncbi:MAG: DNA cytosine methyltransferase [bacterium]